MSMLLLSSTMATNAQIDCTELTQEELLILSQKKFEGRDVDYYFRSSTDNSKWEVFVDAQPLAGWHHECYLLSFPKLRDSLNEVVEPEIDSLTIRPEGHFDCLSVKNRFAPLKNSPIFNNGNLVMGNESNNKTYALIISGGINIPSNHTRYWNDCSFIYQTLRHKYRVPKENIYAIMSDGTDPAPDMTLTNEQITSQPLDLDFDGENDIEYAATNANITSILNNLASILNSENQLFIYVIDHGGYVPSLGYSICLWGVNEYMSATELANLLKPFSDKNVNLNIVMGQCQSGGFITKFKEKGIKCVLATACKANESSWSRVTGDYDEFVYHWTSGINGATPSDSITNADYDNNGQITMHEAFRYANMNDRYNGLFQSIDPLEPDTITIEQWWKYAKETPQYYSYPSQYGKDLSLNLFPKPVELYIKDDVNDFGKEPNKEDIYWNSPSITVSKTYPQPVGSTEVVKDYKVKVKIENKGRQTYEGKSKRLNLYLSMGTSVFDVVHTVLSDDTSLEDSIKCHLCGSVTIPQIESDGFKELSFDLNLPDDFEPYEVYDNKQYKKSFSLLAKISPEDMGSGLPVAHTILKPKESKYVAQLNISNLDGDSSWNGNSLLIANHEGNPHSYSLEIKSRTGEGKDIFGMAFVSLIFDDILEEAWNAGGKVSSDVSVHLKGEPIPSYIINNYYKNLTFDVNSEEGKIEGINLASGSLGRLRLKTDFFGLGGEPYYDFDLIQRDENGDVVGGMTFTVKAPETPSVAYSDIINVQANDDGKYTLSIDEEEFNSCVWILNNQKLSTSKAIKVNPVSSSSKYKVAAINENGELATEEVNLSSLLGIEVFRYNAPTNEIELELKRAASGGINIYVSSLTDNKIIQVGMFNPGEKTKKFNISSLTNGIYVLSLFQNDFVIDSRKFTK